MNANQIMNMVMRIIMRKAISKGIDVGVQQASNLARPKQKGLRPQQPPQQGYIEPGFDGELYDVEPDYVKPAQQPRTRQLTAEEKAKQQEARRARRARRAAREAQNGGRRSS